MTDRPTMTDQRRERIEWLHSNDCEKWIHGRLISLHGKISYLNTLGLLAGSWYYPTDKRIGKRSTACWLYDESDRRRRRWLIDDGRSTKRTNRRIEQQRLWETNKRKFDIVARQDFLPECPRAPCWFVVVSYGQADRQAIKCVRREWSTMIDRRRWRWLIDDDDDDWSTMINRRWWRAECWTATRLNDDFLYCVCKYDLSYGTSY